MSLICARVLAIVLLHRQHISFLPLAIIYSCRALFRNSQASDDQPEFDIGAGQSQQLHKVSEASDFDVGGCCDFVLHMSASFSGVNALDYFGARENHQ